MSNEETNKNEQHSEHENAEQLITDANGPDMGEHEQGAKEEPIDELTKAQRDAADWKDKYMRLTADFDNFRKQKNRERIELLSNASRDVISGLLPVLDVFDANSSIKSNTAGVVVVNSITSTPAEINAVAAARASSAVLVRIMATRPDSNESSLAI